jgi:hypothetical protein
MSYEWSEKENKYTMFTGEEKEDVLKNFEPVGNRKELTRGDQLSGILNKDNKTEKRNDLKMKKKINDHNDEQIKILN